MSILIGFLLIIVLSFLVVNSEHTYDISTSKRFSVILNIILLFYIINWWNDIPVLMVFFVIASSSYVSIYSFKTTVLLTAVHCMIMIFLPVLDTFYDLRILDEYAPLAPSFIKIQTILILIFSTGLLLLNIYHYTRIYRLEILLEIKGDPSNEEENTPFQPIEKIEDPKFDLIYNEILNYFDTYKPYQDPDFNLAKLARAVSSNTYYVSVALNQKSKMNFKSFLNTYRIEQVKEELKNSKHKKFTLKHIYTKAGFTHQSTFNRIFKQIEGISPNEFIKQIEIAG
ncbi:AraC-like DNA-binding protein [Chryseobacterium defluvii]|uniref:AraC-like DNA-binding protein n=1 Tax=Chryseobacterium defluvii TaxID=160396 RepID=A0A840KG97_9FLAO|nr:helix-turn-helix domain-containing protein [Chryseobacterium defluvii]MBB4806553.1 AraC-like DNA-binding protein [Chryseobacterium defluvii]